MPIAEPAERPAGWRTWANRIARWAVILATGYFLYASLERSVTDPSLDWDAVARSIRWPVLAVSLLAQALGYYAFGLAWHRGLAAIGGRVHWATSVWAFSWANLTKYVPGKVLIPVARVAMFKAYGVPGAASICGLAIEAICVMVVGFAIFAVTIPFQTVSDPALRYYFWFCLLAIPLVSLLHPRVLEAATRYSLRVLRQPIASFSISVRELVRLMGWWVVAWAVMGGSFTLFVAAITPVSAAAAPFLAGSWAFSWVLGMISFITPAGVGIREAILIGVMLPQVPPEARGLVPVIAVASRLWTTAADGIGIGLAFAMHKAVGQDRVSS